MLMIQRKLKKVIKHWLRQGQDAMVEVAMGVTGVAAIMVDIGVAAIMVVTGAVAITAVTGAAVTAGDIADMAKNGDSSAHQVNSLS